MTAIEWTDVTWNPVTGCTKVSPGCKHCYAERITERFGRQKFTDVVLHPDRLGAPLRWRKPRRVFVNSMSDLFHEAVPDEFIDQVFDTMANVEQHRFQILTKRSDRMREYLSGDEERCILHNVWLGVSVEDQTRADERIPLLLETPAAVRFVSCEPLLGPVDLTRFLPCDPYYEINGFCVDRRNLDSVMAAMRGGPVEATGMRGKQLCLDWVIIGGESGPGARPMDPEWARSIRDRCVNAGVPFFFKQWGGRTPKAGGRELDGRTWDQFPAR